MSPAFAPLYASSLLTLRQVTQICSSGKRPEPSGNAWFPASAKRLAENATVPRNHHSTSSPRSHDSELARHPAASPIAGTPLNSLGCSFRSNRHQKKRPVLFRTHSSSMVAAISHLLSCISPFRLHIKSLRTNFEVK